jgi:hypothetical protein
MDDNRTWQRLAAEFLGTAFLVFVGVGSVPAFALVRGDAPFAPADLGFISLAFGTIVVATVYVFGYISGNHINPAVTLALAVTGKFAWAPRSARSPSSARSARRRANSASGSRRTATSRSGRRSRQSSSARSCSCSRSSASSTARPRPDSRAS